MAKNVKILTILIRPQIKETDQCVFENGPGYGLRDLLTCKLQLQARGERQGVVLVWTLRRASLMMKNCPIEKRQNFWQWLRSEEAPYNSAWFCYSVSVILSAVACRSHVNVFLVVGFQVPTSTPRRASRGASEAAVLCYCSIASFVAIAIIAQKFLHRLQLQLTSLRTYLYGLVLNLIENAYQSQNAFSFSYIHDFVEKNGGCALRVSRIVIATICALLCRKQVS